jgi:hypothetical protein
MFLGMQVPYQKKHQPNENEQAILQQHKLMIAAKAAEGASVQEALQLIRDPRWRWT